jgi:AcrR family transcriptional regulator
VPRNRTEIGRERKIAEILEVAEPRLREGGYDALSIARIARELNLAPNSIYWYFSSKDELFAVAVEHMLLDIVARKPPNRRSLARRVLWFVEQLDELENLRIGLYDRARASPVVAELVSRLDASSRLMLGNALSGEVAEHERALATETLLATIEGVRLRGLRGAQRRRVLSYALRRLTAGSHGTAT